MVAIAVESGGFQLEEGVGVWRRGLHRRSPGEEIEAGRLLGARGGHERARVLPRRPRTISWCSTSFDEVYQLAADMGGMGFIHSAECEIMHNSVLINVHMTHSAADGDAALLLLLLRLRLPRHEAGEPEMTEAEAMPANPDNEYGWEKLYSERIAHGLRAAPRDGRCASPASRTATAPRAPGAAAARRRPRRCAARWPRRPTAATMEVWGDGSAVRSYTYVDDMVDGIYRLMQSDLQGAVNIGCPEYVSVS
jgi:GDP-D-mannose 3', 5'-epimerase